MPLSKPHSSRLHWQPLDEQLRIRAGDKETRLQGFDAEFADIADFIIKITHRIWEQKNVGLCRRYYVDSCPVHTLGGYSERVEDIVRNTLDTLTSFPDRSLIGENVIWSEESDGSYYSSHRITSTMTHTGRSEFGPPTGRAGWCTTIADCICRENRVEYEWLMRDNAFLALQLGLDPRKVAEQWAQRPLHDRFWPWWDGEIERLRGTGKVTPPRSDEEAFGHQWVSRLLGSQEFGAVSDLYHPNARIQWPGGRHPLGLRGHTGTLIHWMAQFRDARAACDHVAFNRIDEKYTDVAIRWTLAGEFATWDPALAPLAGQPALVLAATHLTLFEGRISEEWTVFDEIAFLANLHRSRGRTT